MVLLFVCMSSRKLGTENRRSPVALLMVCLSLAWSEPLFRSRAALSMMLLRVGTERSATLQHSYREVSGAVQFGEEAGVW